MICSGLSYLSLTGRMVVYAAICFLLSCAMQVQAQYMPVKTWIVPRPSLLAADPTGNAYVATGNELWMFNRRDTLYRKFSNIQMGRLTSIDASNPLKILLYFRDQGRIQFLDNNISEFTQPVELEAYGLEQATLACTSYDNGFWVYTPVNFGMVRFDQSMQITTEIRNIHQLINAPEINPQMMQESSNKIYLSDPDIGIMIFDVFGGYVKTIPVKGITTFQVLENRLVYMLDDGLYLYDLTTFSEEKWTWPPGVKPLQAAITYDKLYLLTMQSLMIYKSE